VLPPAEPDIRGRHWWRRGANLGATAAARALAEDQRMAHHLQSQWSLPLGIGVVFGLWVAVGIYLLVRCDANRFWPAGGRQWRERPRPRADAGVGLIVLRHGALVYAALAVLAAPSWWQSAGSAAQPMGALAHLASLFICASPCRVWRLLNCPLPAFVRDPPGSGPTQGHAWHLGGAAGAGLLSGPAGRPLHDWRLWPAHCCT